MFLDFVCPSPKSSHWSGHKSLLYSVRVFSSFLVLTSLCILDPKSTFRYFSIYFNVHLLPVMIQVNVFSSYTLLITLLSSRSPLCLSVAFRHVYLLLNYFTFILTCGVQISVVYLRSSSSVWIVVGSGVILVFPGTHCYSDPLRQGLLPDYRNPA
jgi:hypothetical protein